MGSQMDNTAPIWVLYAIICTFVLLGGGLLFWGWRDWRGRFPDDLCRISGIDVGVRYLDGVDRVPWPGLKQTLHAAYSVLLENFPAEAGVVMGRIWIEVVPSRDEIRSSFLSSLETAGYDRIVGTVDTVRLWGILFPKYIVRVHQPPGEDGVYHAKHSALLHEIAEHVLPMYLVGDPNPDPVGHKKRTSSWARYTSLMKTRVS